MSNFLDDYMNSFDNLDGPEERKGQGGFFMWDDYPIDSEPSPDLAQHNNEKIPETGPESGKGNREINNNNTNNSIDLEALMDESLDDMFNDNQEPPIIVETPIDSFNNVFHLKGLKEGYHVIMAAPGIAKTSMACWFADEIAHKDITVMFFSFEESVKAIHARSISRISKTIPKDLIEYCSKEEDKIVRNQACKEYREYTNHNKFVFDLASCKEPKGESEREKLKRTYGFNMPQYLDIYGIEHLIRQMRERENRNKKPLVVILDFIQRIPTGKNGERRDNIQAICDQMTILSVELNVIFIVLSQTNRISYLNKVESEIEYLKSPGESNAIEIGAYSVSVLLYEDMKQLSGKGLKNIKLSIIKNRGGDCMFDDNGIKLTFDKSCGQFNEAGQEQSQEQSVKTINNVVDGQNSIVQQHLDKMVERAHKQQKQQETLKKQIQNSKNKNA